jgi:hypothetical protein
MKKSGVWHILVTTALNGRLSQELKASLGYMERHCLEKKKKKKTANYFIEMMFTSVTLYSCAFFGFNFNLSFQDHFL